MEKRRALSATSRYVDGQNPSSRRATAICAGSRAFFQQPFELRAGILAQAGAHQAEPGQQPRFRCGIRARHTPQGDFLRGAPQGDFLRGAQGRAQIVIGSQQRLVARLVSARNAGEHCARLCGIRVWQHALEQRLRAIVLPVIGELRSQRDPFRNLRLRDWRIAGSQPSCNASAASLRPARNASAASRRSQTAAGMPCGAGRPCRYCKARSWSARFSARPARTWRVSAASAAGSPGHAPNSRSAVRGRRAAARLAASCT